MFFYNIEETGILLDKMKSGGLLQIARLAPTGGFILVQNEVNFIICE
jgi:hypothetical protein